MIGIIGAMKEEIKAILDQMRNVSTLQIEDRTFYSGTIHEQGIVVVQAGIGKTNAAITTTLLVQHFKVKALINVGVAGGQNGVKHGDIIVSRETVYHDVDVTSFGHYLHGQVPGHEPTFVADSTLIKQFEKVLQKLAFSFKTGIIASGDQFVYDVNTIAKINAVYEDIYAIEMEACAIAQTATIFHIPFIIIRSISDVLGDEDQSTDFDLFLESSANKAAAVIVEFLHQQ